MFFHDAENFSHWLNGRYVQNLRRHVGDREAMEQLTEEQVQREVDEALAEIAEIARRDPTVDPDEDDFEDDDDDFEDRGGEG